MTEKCPLCGSDLLTSQPSQNTFGHFYNCPQCGRFTTCSDVLGRDIENNTHIIAGYLITNNRQNKGKPFELSDQNVERILNHPSVPRRLIEKADRILTYCYEKTDNLGAIVPIDEHEIYFSFVKNQEEFHGILEELEKEQYLEAIGITDENEYRIKLSFKGKTRAEELIRINAISKRVFVAMQFSDEMLDLFERTIKPTCAEMGYEAFHVGKIEHNNDINDEIIAGIKASRFVIADFSDNNYGAYFEAGYAQGMGLPVIRICKKERLKGIHFDVNHYSMVLWENDKSLQDGLRNRIMATIED